MSEQAITQQATQPTPPADPKPARREISDPREVAALVLARTKQVTAKKDELTLAIDALIDVAKQLTRSYGAQLVAIEHLRLRVKALEEAAAASAAAAEQPVGTLQ